MPSSQSEKMPSGGDTTTSPSSSSSGPAVMTVTVKPSHLSPYGTRDKVIGWILILSGAFLVLDTIFLAFTGRLSILQPKDRFLVHASLSSFSGKMELAAKYWIISLSFLFFAIHLVMNGRVSNSAANPLAGNEDKITIQKNVFANSIEQFLLSVASQTAALPYLTADQVLNLLPLYNVLFLIGRLCFWIGYPKKRGFGFALTMFPTSIAFYFTVYSFFTRTLDFNGQSLFHLTW